jgi:hypothetical protein
VTTQPIEQHRVAGQNINFSVIVAHGTPPYTFKWKKSVGGGASQTLASEPSNFTTSVFEIASVNINNEGNYWCEVTDYGGGIAATSSHVSLAVNEYPVVAAESSAAVDENSNEAKTVFTVSATDQNSEQSLTYTIIGGDPSHYFRINETTGEILVSRAGADQQYGLNHEHK